MFSYLQNKRIKMALYHLLQGVKTRRAGVGEGTLNIALAHSSYIWTTVCNLLLLRVAMFIKCCLKFKKLTIHDRQSEKLNTSSLHLKALNKVKMWISLKNKNKFILILRFCGLKQEGWQTLMPMSISYYVAHLHLHIQWVLVTAKVVDFFFAQFIIYWFLQFSHLLENVFDFLTTNYTQSCQPMEWQLNIRYFQFSFLYCKRNYRYIHVHNTARILNETWILHYS